jgi:hypothetical protein
MLFRIALLASLCFTAELRAADPVPSSTKAVPQSATPAAAKPAAAATAAPKKNTEPAPDTNVISGTLLTADGSPVAGATVVLYNRGNKSVKSDIVGQFRFNKVPHNNRDYFILARHGNLITKETKVQKLPGSKNGAELYAPLRLTLTDGKQVQFTLTSKETGKPAVGAHIRLGYPDPRNVLTDKHGVALVDGLLPKKYTFNIYCESFSRKSMPMDLSKSPAAQKNNVALDPGGVIRGVVVDEKGKPLSGVYVYFSIEGTDTGWTGDAGNTDKQGKFRDRFTPLNTPIQISYGKDKYDVQNSDETKSIILTAKKRQVDLHIVMVHEPPGGSVAGTVTDRAGHLIASANITVVGLWNKKFPTDAKGRFRVDDLPNVERYGNGNWLGVTAKGYAPQAWGETPGTAAHPAEVAFKLEPGHSVHGRVVDAQGKPVTRASFSLRSPDYPQGGDWQGNHRTDKDGKFSFDSLPANVQIGMNGPSGINVNDMHLKIDSPQEQVYKLDPPATVRAKVVDAETGKPVTKFHVRLSMCETREADDPQVTVYSGGRWFQPGVMIDAKDGRFTIDELGYRCPQQLIVEADNYERNVVPRIIPLHADQATELKIVLLPVRSSDYSSVRGQIVGADGKGIAGVQLRLLVTTRPSAGPNDWQLSWQMVDQWQYNYFNRTSVIERFDTASTDDNGRFQFSKVMPGRYVQLFYWGDEVPKMRWSTPEKTQPGKDRTITINVPKPAKIHGTIDRTKLADASSISLSKNDDPYLSYGVSLTAKQSTFEFDDLAPGEYSINVYGKQKKVKQGANVFFTTSNVASDSVRINAGETKDVHLNTPNQRQ